MAISQVPVLSTASSGRAPLPMGANCVSWPLATTGSPSGRPVASDACAVSPPMTVPGLISSGNRDASTPAASSSSDDQSRRARSSIIMVDALVTSSVISPVNRSASRPGIISHLAARSSASGAFCRNQRILNSVLKAITW